MLHLRGARCCFPAAELVTCHVDDAEQSRVPVGKLRAAVVAFKQQNNSLLSSVMPQDGEANVTAQQVKL